MAGESPEELEKRLGKLPGKSIRTEIATLKKKLKRKLLAADPSVARDFA
ncbi:MAG: hypothetical protein GXP25_03385 [Planctomycetes bacterium]|nr:hypothetical protein [Planctomycetota bacterium]